MVCGIAFSFLFVQFLVERRWGRSVRSHPFRKVRGKDGAPRGFGREVVQKQGERPAALTVPAIPPQKREQYGNLIVVAMRNLTR